MTDTPHVQSDGNYQGRSAASRPRAARSSGLATPTKAGGAQDGTPAPVAYWGNLNKAQCAIIAHEARVLCERFVPITLWSMLSQVASQPLSAKIYLDRFVEDSGKTTDPVERVLLEQLAMAHLRLALLSAEASKATGVEVHRVLNSAAARLLSEIRKLALAIKAYRQPPVTKSFAVIQQQNVANEQKVSYTHQTGPEAKETLKVYDTKVTGSGGQADDIDPGNRAPSQSPPSDRWSRQPLETAAAQ